MKRLFEAVHGEKMLIELESVYGDKLIQGGHLRRKGEKNGIIISPINKNLTTRRTDR